MPDLRTSTRKSGEEDRGKEIGAEDGGWATHGSEKRTLKKIVVHAIKWERGATA